MSGRGLIIKREEDWEKISSEERSERQQQQQGAAYPSQPREDLEQLLGVLLVFIGEEVDGGDPGVARQGPGVPGPAFHPTTRRSPPGVPPLPVELSGVSIKEICTAFTLRVKIIMTRLRYLNMNKLCNV